MYFSFLLPSLPALQPLQGWSLASPPPPSCLTLCVCLLVLFCPCLQLSLSPILLQSYPPGIGPLIPGHGISASLWALPAKHIFRPVPGQPGHSGLIFNQCFCLTRQMLPKPLGRRVTCLLWGPRVGAGWKGERACLPWTVLILGKS